MRRYLGQFGPWGPALAIGAVLTAASSAVAPAAVLLVREALASDSAAPALLLAVLYAADGALKLIRTRVTKGVAWGMTAALRAELHAHWLRLPPGDPTGERLARLTGEVDDLQYGISGVVTLARNPLTVVLLALTATSLAPRLALAAAASLPLLALVARWGGLRVARRAAEARDARAALATVAHEQLAGLATVQACAAEDAETARFARVVDSDRRARVRLDVERLLPSVATQLVVAVALGALLWLGRAEVLADRLDTATLVAFAAALGLAARPVIGLSEGWALVQRSIAALDRVRAALDTLPDVAPGGAPVGDGPLDLHWDDVDVTLGDHRVLDGASLRIAPGELVALVGPSGAGKTTLLRLLGRHRHADHGTVRVGGVDVRDLDVRSLRRAVAVVDQDAFLFSRTIGENVALGAPDATPADIRAALRAAGATFVDALPEGIHTALRERGHNLSAGERQRLCLARALLTNAPVLLLDEPTSQVDAETEAAILGVLRALRGRTIVLVVHDLRAARIADRIAVVDRGRIHEVGTHLDLIGVGGRYAALWRATPGEA